VNTRGSAELYHAPTPLTDIRITPTCGSSASPLTIRNGNRTGKLATGPSVRADPCTDAFVTAASCRRPSTNRPITYSSTLITSMTTTSAYGTGLPLICVMRWKICTGVAS
jgi:hypothetical protein